MAANMAVVGILSIVMSVAFAYFPGLKSWYEAQEADVKGLVQIAGLLILSFGGLLPVCFGWFQQIPLTCDQVGVEQAAINFIVALGANQGTFAVINGVKKGQARRALKKEQ